MGTKKATGSGKTVKSTTSSALSGRNAAVAIGKPSKASKEAVTVNASRHSEALIRLANR